LTLQNPGAPNVPLIQVGDSVTIGQNIADSKERVSAPVHSPISGKVVKFDDTYNSCYAECSEAIYVENDRKNLEDKTLQPISESELKDTSNDFLIKRIMEAGVIGLGGRVFRLTLNFLHLLIS
jgi:electron transport complex protein RnfC